MGNNVFQSPFNITSVAINAALAGQTITPGNVTAASAGWIGASGRSLFRFPSVGEFSFRDYAETIQANLVVEANDVLSQRRGTNAQINRLYNTYTDSSNYERATVGWLSNVFTIDSAISAGTGISRALRMASGGTTIDLEVSGNLGSITANRHGTSGVTLFALNSTGLTSTAVNFVRFMPSINQASGSYNVLDINPTEVGVGAGPHYLMRGRIGAGADVFNVQRDGTVLAGALVRLAGTTSSFAALKRSGATLQSRLGDDSAFADFYAASLFTNSSTVFFGSNGTLVATADGSYKFANSANIDFSLLQFGGTTSSFPAIKRYPGAALFQFRTADDSAFIGVELGHVRYQGRTVTQLGTAGGSGAGSVAYVTDATATTPRSVAAGGGSNKVMVWSDGANWLIF